MQVYGERFRMVDKSQINQTLLTILPETNYYVTYELMNTIIAYQRVWSEFSTWMRNFMYSTVNNSPDLSAVTNRLYSTQTDFYNLFRVFYGPEVSQYFINLILSFITSATSVINGVKNNDQAAVNSSTVQWYQNADTLASFLAQINPFWDANQWKNLLYQYISMSNQAITSTAGGNFEQEIAINNRIQDLTYILGSYMARGIIARNVTIAPEGKNNLISNSKSSS